MTQLIQPTIRTLASVRDNSIVRWDGTTNKFVQTSDFIIDDGGNMSGGKTILMGQVTWNNVNSFSSTKGLSFTCASGFDLNFTGGDTSSNVNFLAFGGQVNIDADGGININSSGGSIVFGTPSGNMTEFQNDVIADSFLYFPNASTGAIFFGLGSIVHDGTGFIFNPKITGSSEMVVGSTSGTADGNLRVFRMGIGGSVTSGTSLINCVVSGSVRTALNFVMTATSGAILAPLVLNAIDSSTSTSIVFANTLEYTLNTTTHTGSNSMESLRITMGTGAGILLPATTVYMRGITLDLTGKGVGGTHVAAAVIRQTGLFQRKMTDYAGTATTDTTGCYWGNDLVMQSGSKVNYDGSESSGSTTLTVIKGNTYHVYDSGSTELWTFVNGVNVIGSTSTLNKSKVDLGTLAGTSTTYAKVGGIIDVNTTAVGNVLTGEDDLITFSVPANTMSTNGQSIYFEMSGTYAGNVGTKRVRIKYGATTMFDSTALAINGGKWTCWGRIIRTSAATQNFFGEFSTNNALLVSQSFEGAAAETLTGAVTLKSTGEATLTNDITHTNNIVRYDPNE